MIRLVVALAPLVFLYGQSGPSQSAEPKFSRLSPDDEGRLERQRAVIAAAASRYGLAKLSRTKSDLPVLQKLIDERAFRSSQTYELQCLGVAFGDVLSSEFPLQWEMVTDEYGTDPTLRFKKTTLHFNALTMISKRIERNERIDLSELLHTTRQQLTHIDQNVH